MAMPFEDFFRRMTGQPMQLPGAAMADRPTTATVARPTMDQLQAQDYQYAAMNRMGQLGMLLMAAGQRLTPAQRATILGQAPQYMGGIQDDVTRAAQARLYGMSTQAKQDEIARQSELDKQSPALAEALGLSPQLRNALSPEQIRDMYIKRQMADPRESQLMDLKIQEEQARINALNAPKAGPSPQLVDLPGGGKGWATPGSTDVVPIGGAGKGGVDPEMAKRTEAEDKNLTYAKEAIAANRALSAPDISTELISGTNKRLNMIPTLEGSWAGEKYLSGDLSANSFVDSVVRPRSGAVVGKEELENNKRIFTPSPGDSPDRLFQKAQMRAQHIQSLIAGANPADRPMLQQMYQESVKELQDIYGSMQKPGAGPQLPQGVTSIRKVR